MFNKVYKYADTLPFSFRKDEFKKGKRKKNNIMDWIYLSLSEFLVPNIRFINYFFGRFIWFYVTLNKVTIHSTILYR